MNKLLSALFVPFLLAGAPVRGVQFKNFKIKDLEKWQNLKLDSLEGSSRINKSSRRSPQSSGKPLLYENIFAHFNNNSKSVTKKQLQEMANKQNLLLSGGINNISLTMIQPFANFNIELKKDIGPDLLDENRFIVTDTISININASTLLNNMRDENIISIEDGAINAFAGLAFKRTFRSIYFVHNYQEAIEASLDRLLFSFLFFRANNFKKLSPGEMLTQEDFFGIDLGIQGNTSIPVGIDTSIGGFFNNYKLARSEIRVLDDTDFKSNENSKMNINFRTSDISESAFKVSILADFFNLVRMKIIGLDFDYRMENSYKVNLSFNDNDIQSIEDNTRLSEQIEKILGHQMPDIEVLTPYIVSEEKRRKEIMESKYYLLFFGKSRNHEVEKLDLADKDGINKTFFRHNFEKINYKEDFTSWLVRAVVKSLVGIDTIVKKVFFTSKGLRMEYASKNNLIDSKKDIVLKKDRDKLSFNFTHEYYFVEDNEYNKSKIMSVLDNFSNADMIIAEKIDKNQLKAPFFLNARLSMGERALEHFNHLPLNKVYDNIDRLCITLKNNREAKDPMLRCQHRLYKSYNDYLVSWLYYGYTGNEYKSCVDNVYWLMKNNKRGETYSASWRRKRINLCLQTISHETFNRSEAEIPLWSLQPFLRDFVNMSQSKLDSYYLFGWDNVFLDGNFKAKQENQKRQFMSFFKEGVFKNTGVLKRHLKASQ